MSNIKIKVLTKDDWGVYKSLRLSSLSDSPDSFGSTFERENAFKDEEWSCRLDYMARKIEGLLVVALLNDKPAGLACGLIHAKGDQDGHVYQMWVSPEARGLGLGNLLLSHIISWAKNAGLKSLSLAVTTTNISAINLYRDLGFYADGALEQLRDGIDIQVQSMTLNLDATKA